MDNYYIGSKDEVYKKLATDESGLSTDEAKIRIEKYGENQLREEKKDGFLKKLLGQFKDFLVIILIAAALISLFLGKKKDAMIILTIVVVNAFLGLYQEGKAEKSLDALKKMSSPNGKVLRDGKLVEIAATEIVPGDIVILETGDIIPADLRLIESHNLKIEESSLTGESLPVDKHYDQLIESEVSLGDRHNMAYMSTIVTYGRGRGIVVGTGHDTEIGHIATMIQSYSDELTPLQKQLNKLGKSLGIATIIICILVFILGLLQGREAIDMFMVAISLAVAAIPEGLPAIVTIVLALGMNRMVKRNAIVKKLLAVETLGSTTVICSDKTGTLTQNEMTVVKAFTNMEDFDLEGTGYAPHGNFIHRGKLVEDFSNYPNLELMSKIALLSNDADLDEKDGVYSILGDPTEGALVTFALKFGLNKYETREKYKRLEELPFDSDRKMMTVFTKSDDDKSVLSMTKGGPDIIIDRCSHILLDNEIKVLSPQLKDELLKKNSEYSRSALRVLALAYRQLDQIGNPSSDVHENNMVFVGLVGMIDPPRPEAKEAIKLCGQAGIKTVMITGDYKETAFAIAKELGMATSPDEAIMGAELDKYSPEELRELVNHIRVYARVSPEHKVKIIQALKDNGEITSMTGDGVNDALALKKADIGVAMGITGTDVAKNTADLILTDDNFSSIVAAVEEGRIIYSNIKKFVFFLLSCNIGEILLVVFSLLLNLPMPLLPIQLLWLNLVTDSFPALALGVEKGEPNIMKVNPRDPKSSILDRKLGARVLIQSLAISIASIVSFKWGLKNFATVDEARTIVFTTLILSELLRAYSSRSQDYSIFQIGIFSNKNMVYSTAFSFGLMLLVIYIPFLRPIFDTFPLGLNEWRIILPLAFIPLLVGELGKLFLNKK